MRMRLAPAFALCTAALSLGGCGGGSDTGGGTARCNPGTSASMTIRNTGLTPAAVCVVPTGTVTFTNQDTVPHDLVADDPSCTELNTGVMQPAASVPKTFPDAKTCAFHDNLNPAAAAFKGTVAVNAGQVEGPGY
jgi:plastocyanin